MSVMVEYFCLVAVLVAVMFTPGSGTAPAFTVPRSTTVPWVDGAVADSVDGPVAGAAAGSVAGAADGAAAGAIDDAGTDGDPDWDAGAAGAAAGTPPD
jgi:hypothetical protein